MASKSEFRWIDMTSIISRGIREYIFIKILFVPFVGLAIFETGKPRRKQWHLMSLPSAYTTLLQSLSLFIISFSSYLKNLCQIHLAFIELAKEILK